MKHRRIAPLLILCLGACSVSTQQEVELGQNYSQQINAQLPIVQDPEVNRYINLLGDSIARLADDRNLTWHFYVVNSAEVNAFAVPGGFVYVNRGLIDRTRKMDQLAGVLGHEIGHVIRRHSVSQMQKEQGANIGLMLGCILTRVCDTQASQAAINIGGTALFAKFSRDDEREADEEGVKNVVRAGISPSGMPEMFQMLLNERNRSGGNVEAWFATHPLEEERIQNTEKLIAAINPLILKGLSMDSPRYQAFKQRVASLPPPPPPRRQGGGAGRR
jgi:predicted Zn-dependent protease